MIERRNGTYGAVKYDQSSCDLLDTWMKQCQIPNPLNTDKLHTTIIYSRKPIPSDIQVNLDEITLKRLGWKFSPKEFKLFQSSSSSSVKDVLVMTLDAPELNAMHDLLKEQGATHDFDTYEPHITLSYSVPEDFDVESINLPPLYFTPVKVYFEPLNLNWKEQ